MTPRDIVDISEYAQSIRQRRFRRYGRVIVPVGCLLVMIGAIAGIAAFTYTQNRRDALRLSNDLIASLNGRITAQVTTYLAPVSKMVEMAAGVLDIQSSGVNGRNGIEPLAFRIFQAYPQIVAFNIGFPTGSFLMIKRMPDGAFDTKTIQRSRDTTRVTWVRRNPAGGTIAIEHAAADDYDPRARPWYTGALKAQDVFWTDVYIFFTDRKPGITAAIAVRGPQGRVVGVLSMDVLLEQLSTFLSGLHIGKSGQALIIDQDGRLVARGRTGRMLVQEGEILRPVYVQELGDPVLTRAFNRFRIEGHGSRHMEVENQRMISMVSPLRRAVGREWSVMTIVPESDFVGFVRHNLRSALVMSIGVMGLASLLVGLLIWQGLRADRSARIVLENRKLFERQSVTFSELANDEALFATMAPEPLAGLTESVARAATTRRISVWRLAADKTQLICEDSYDRESGGHTQGTVLNRHEFPQLFDALINGEEMVLADAGTDTRTAELHRVYLGPLGCSTLLALPIRLREAAVGGLWFEGQSASRIWKPEEIAFGRAIAGLLALRRQTGQFAVTRQVDTATETYQVDPPGELRTATRAATFPEEAPVTGLIAGGRANRFYERLAERGLDAGSLAADVFPDITVFVLRFTDHVTLAQSLGTNARANAIGHLIRHLEELATAHGADYLKIMSDEIVGAAGFGGQAEQGVGSIADLTLELQDKCHHLFAALNAQLNYCIGVDTGPVIGSTVGEKRDYYNLWGEAVRSAAMLAEAGVAGAIQVSESTYQRLRSGYIFKKRGSFYLEDSGEMDTYVLTGRL